MRTKKEIEADMVKLKSEKIEIEKNISKLREERFEAMGLTEICWACNSSGRTVIGHSFRDGTIYGGTCSKCNGVGRLRKQD